MSKTFRVAYTTKPAQRAHAKVKKLERKLRRARAKQAVLAGLEPIVEKHSFIRTGKDNLYV